MAVMTENNDRVAMCLNAECAGLKLPSSHASPKFDQFMHVLEKISAVALGIFSAYTNLPLFVPFFLIGISLGMHTFFEVQKKNGSHAHAGCSHGFMELLTGVKLPAPFSLAANVAITICHIDHHDTVFVPIVGLTIGAWAGKGALQVGEFISRQFAAVRKPA